MAAASCGPLEQDRLGRAANNGGEQLNGRSVVDVHLREIPVAVG